MSTRILKQYVNNARPAFGNDEFLFLNYRGRPIVSIGYFLTLFFRATSEWHITTKTIRILQVFSILTSSYLTHTLFQETEAEAALRLGNATVEQRAALTYTQGHSSGTAKRFYQQLVSSVKFCLSKY